MLENLKLKKDIVTLGILKAANKKVAFIKGNRMVQEKNVNAKWASLREYGQIVPAIMVNGEDVQVAGLEIVDAETGKPVAPKDYGNYVVILDGQHRYTAYIKNEKSEEENKGEFYLMYPLNEGATPQEILAEANIATKAWSGGDFAGGALLTCKDEPLPVVEFIHELTSCGVPLSTAQRWACRKNMNIDSTMLENAMKRKKIHPSLKFDTNVEEGHKLWDAARHNFGMEVLKHRYFIDFFLDKYDNAMDRTGLWERFIEFLKTMSRTDVDSIEKAKSQGRERTKEQVVVAKLEELYSKFEMK